MSPGPDAAPGSASPGRGRGLRAERAADDPAVLDDHGAVRPGDLQPLREAGVGGGAGQDRADGARAEPDDGQRGVLDLDLVRLGGADRGDLGYRAHAPAQQVHVVDALVHQRAAVHGPGAAPRGAVVVGLRPVPLGAGLGEHQPAQGPVAEQPLQLDQAGIEAVLGDHGQRHPGRAGRLDEPVGRGQRDVDRLLHHQVLAGPGGADADLGVQAARHADAHHVDIRPGEQLVQAGFGGAAAGGGEGRGGPVGHVGHGRQPGAGQGGDRGGVHGRDHPGADDPEAALWCP